MSSSLVDMVDWLKAWFYDESEVDSLLASKQNTLVSGENIKTINQESLLGDGNIVIDETNIDDYDVTFTYSFGVGGIDDTITIHTELLERSD